MAETFSEVKVHGFEEFCEVLEKHKGKHVFAYFSGSKNEDGMSWCPNCVKAEPVVRGELKKLSERSIFIYCQIERPCWMDPNNEFKKHLKLPGIPALLKCGTVNLVLESGQQPQNLVDKECLKADLVERMFAVD